MWLLIEELGNPFADTGSDLFALDSKQIMPSSVLDTIKSAEDIGTDQYHTFLEERLYSNTIDFTDSLSKNILSLLCSDTQNKTLNTLPISPIWMMTFHFMYRVRLEGVTWVHSLNM